MSGWMGLLQGLGSGLEQVGLMQMQGQQKHQQMEDENRLLMLRERQQARLRPPTEKTVEMDDPDQPGHKISKTMQYVLPDDDTGKGSWQEVSRVHVPVKWEKTERYVNAPDGTPMVQKGWEDPNDPTKFKPDGDASPKYDPEGQKRTAIEAGNLKNSQDRLSLDRTKFIQEETDKKNNTQPHERYSFHESDDPTNPNKKIANKFDKFTGDYGPVGRTGPQSPGGGMVADMGAQPAAPNFAPKDDAFSSPLSQLSPSATGGGGSAPSMSPQGAKGGDHGGPPSQKYSPSRKRWGWVYPDGTEAAGPHG